MCQVKRILTVAVEMLIIPKESRNSSKGRDLHKSNPTLWLGLEPKKSYLIGMGQKDGLGYDEIRWKSKQYKKKTISKNQTIT